MNNLNINVIDGIMGSGKSTGMINRINYIKQQTLCDKFLVVVPYLEEVKRYAKKLIGFYPLIHDTPPKRKTLEKYLREKKDIICPHQLFLQNPDLITVYAKDYNLVIDEALNSLISIAEFPKLINTNNINVDIGVDSDKKLYLKDVAQTYTFTDTDIDYLINHNYLKYSSTQDNLIVWGDNFVEEHSILNCIKDYFTQNDVYRLEKTDNVDNITSYYISLFPIKTFQVFKSISVMTYLWKAQIMNYYFDFYDAKYTYFYPVPSYPIVANQVNLNTLNYELINPNKNYIELESKDRDFILSDNKKLYLNFEKTVKLTACKNINIPGYILKEDTKTIIKNEKSRTSLYSFWKETNLSAFPVTLSYSYYSNLSDNNKDIFDMLKKNIMNFEKSHIPKEI